MPRGRPRPLSSTIRLQEYSYRRRQFCASFDESKTSFYNTRYCARAPTNSHQRYAFLCQPQQQQQKHYHDRTARSLVPLRKGEVIRFQLEPNSKWEKAKAVDAHTAPRSYIVETRNGKQYRRNRRYLRKTNETAFSTNDAQVENLMPMSADGEPSLDRVNTNNLRVAADALLIKTLVIKLKH